MQFSRPILASVVSRRLGAAAASVLVNALLAFIATRPHTGSNSVISRQPNEDRSIRLTVDLVPASERPPESDRRRPSVRHAVHRAAARPYMPDFGGPPTETAESLQARLADPEYSHEASGLIRLPCDSAAVAVEQAGQVKVSLMIHVGADGRVIESEVHRTSGIASIDEAVNKCARSWGPFPLAIIDGRILESWRLLEWEPASREANL
jgi:TonB family protein